MAATATPQQTQQFLSTVLSQRGPNSLPYEEDTKWLIRQQVMSLIAAFPSLSLTVSTFTHNDGRSLPLLQAHGTIPMAFQGQTYNIPISIRLLESYPRLPPLVYLNPTPDMMIKLPHPHVSPSGLVSHPYLQNWIYPTSNLLHLSRHLSSSFSLDPPLYSHRPPPNHSSYPGPWPPSPYSHSGGLSRVVEEDPADVFRRNAVGKLAEAVRIDLTTIRKSTEAETEGLLGVQGVLRQRWEELRRGVGEMADEKEGLEGMLQAVLLNCDLLGTWLKDHEVKAAAREVGGKGVKAEAEPDEVFDCADGLSKQMLECAASDLAIEDVIYSLDKAAQEGTVPFDQYLRSVRLLSRDQFFHRATAIKVKAVHMQSLVANMATRMQHFVNLG